VPTFLRTGPYRIYFYSHEPNEPVHVHVVHVDRDGMSAKFWLDPVSLAKSLGFSPRELGRIERLVAEHEVECLEAWNGHFPGMETSETRAGERVKDVRVREDALRVDLVEGRTITVPLAWFPRLLHATEKQRSNLEICGGGFGHPLAGRGRGSEHGGSSSRCAGASSTEGDGFLTSTG